jgi:hypothetical protein
MAFDCVIQHIKVNRDHFPVKGFDRFFYLNHLKG